MRCANCIHYDVCYQYDLNDEDENEMCALYQPKIQRGEWMQITDEDGEYCYHKCTNCGQTIESGLDNPPFFNFCPDCGLPMTEKALEILRKRERGEEK